MYIFISNRARKGHLRARNAIERDEWVDEVRKLHATINQGVGIEIEHGQKEAASNSHAPISAVNTHVVDNEDMIQLDEV